MDWQEWQDTKKQIYDFIIENRSMYRDDGVDVGLGDIIDFINATVTKSGRKITVDAHGWGGWPLYDYIVDDDWADTGLAEGTVINTYTGTKIYSTVQGAVDDWAATCVAGTGKSIFICPGHYDENVLITTTAARGIQRISIEGGAGGTAFIDGSITVDGVWFYNSSLKEERSVSVIRNLKVAYRAVGSAGDLIFGTSNLTNSIAGLSFENCNFEGIFKSVYPDVSYATAISHCNFKNCTFHKFNDGGRVLQLHELHFEACTFEDEFEMYANSVTITSEIGIDSHDPPCTFIDCIFGQGMRVADIKSAVFTNCTFHNDSTVTYAIWISGGDGNVYGPTVEEAVFNSCHFKYSSVGQTGNFSYFLLGNAQTNGFMVWEDFIVTDCTFDVPNSLPGAVLAYVVHVIGNLDEHVPKIVFAHNALIEDSDGNRLEDLRAGCYTVSGGFRDSVFGPNEPPNFNIDLATGSANNIYIGTGTVSGAGASSVTIIGGSSSGTTSGILYDSAALTLGYRAFLCRFDTTIVTVAAGTLALTNTATNYVEVDAAGTVSANTTAYTLGHIPLGTVVCAGGDITTITEQSATLDESATNIFTAQSVLAATTAHTPAALTLAEQTVVGRLTGGNVAAVSLGIADNNVVQIDQADVADNDYAKFTAAGIEGRSYAEVVSDLGALTTAAHTAIGDGAPHHAQSHDHSAAGDGQALQPLNYKWPVATELTLNAAGAITVTQSHHTVDTFEDAATDNLVTINGLVANQWYLLRPASGSRTVVVEHFGDNIQCSGGSNFILDDSSDFVLIYAVSTATAYAFGPYAGIADDPKWDSLGQLIYGSANNAAATLDGNITTTKKYLTQTGGGAASAAPEWSTIADADVPATHSGSAHHTRSHTLTSASDHTGTADRVIYVDHAGAVQELALGADGTYLKSNGAAAAPTFDTPAGGGAVATDAIWDAKGDLAGGTGANTAAKLTVGANDTILMAESGETTGLKWAAAAAAGAIQPDDSAAEGSADTYARSDHKHSIVCDTPESIGGVQAASEGAGYNFARSTHVHGIAHSIADNALVTVDQADAADNDYAKFTANGIEGRSYAEVISDLGLTTVATDTIWDAAGDLAVGSGANTAAKLTKGDDGKVLTMVAGAVAWAAAAGGGAMATDPLWDTAGDLAVGTGANTGAKLALTVPGAANLMNVLGVVNAETTPVWKVLFDGTAPEPIGTAAAGTGVVAAHRNHVHSDYVILSWLFSGTCSVKTHEAKFRLPFALTFSDIKLHVLDGNEPSGASLIVDIQTSTDDAAWTTIWTTKPEIDAAAQEEDNNQATSDTAYAANDYFKCMITQIGSTNPGVGLMVNLILTR